MKKAKKFIETTTTVREARHHYRANSYGKVLLSGVYVVKA
jgi:hypothetical protein